MKIYILSVGINDYGNQIALPNLHSAAREACDVFKLLRTQYNADGKLLGDDTAELTGEGDSLFSGLGTRSDILQKINEARCRLRNEDLFIFFYSGHGIPNKPGYLLPHSAEYERPGTYLMYRTLFGTLSTLPCQNLILFLNCCYAGSAAASPAAMPGMVTPKKRAVLYAATDDSNVTLDRIPGNSNLRSPFADALIEYLHEKTRPGESFAPEDLASYLKARASVNLNSNGNIVPLRPEFVSSLNAIGSGSPSFQVRRPGFGIDFHPVHHCIAGELIKIPIYINNMDDKHLELTAKSLVGELDQKNISLGSDNILKIMFDYPGRFELEVTAENTQTREQAFRTLTVCVGSGTTPPPELEDYPLSPCERGRFYRAQFQIKGGSAPFQVEVRGVPEGLQHKMDSQRTIVLVGTAPSAGCGGTPQSNDNGPIIHMLDITVKDSSGRVYREQRQLVLYNSDDYCLIEKNTYTIGCRKDSTTMEAVREVIKLDLDRIIAANQLSAAKMQEALSGATASFADDFLDKIVSVAPNANVLVHDYLIKKYPVTMHDWLCFLRKTKLPFTPKCPWPPKTEKDLNKPVTGISFEAICKYLEWKGTRLPTGREWQIAADGGDGNLFPWGNCFDHSKCNMKGGNAAKDLAPVDAFDDTYKSPFGARDMIGNAAEWVDRRIYWQSEKVFAQIFRGGSFNDSPLFGISSCDSQQAGVLFGTDEDQGQAGETRFDWLGFRDVIELDQTLELEERIVLIPECQIEDEEGRRHVEKFYMSKHNVTNLDYWRFVQSTGFRRPPGWKPHGQDAPFPHRQRHLPVVNVSYLDAHAFCLWKSRISGNVCRLPTSEQWMAALQGGEFRKFPWGNDFNLQFCNEITSGWGKRVSVFELTEGESKHGVLNLVGNVFEWVAPLEVRGGCWHTDCRKLSKVWFKSRVSNKTVDFKQGDIGFRYVLLETTGK